MPIYDYRCPDCGRVVELLLRTSTSSPPACPSCEGTQLKKLPSAGHIARFHASPSRSACRGGGDGCDSPGAGCSEAGSCCRG